jgi:hypothetical protein
MLLAVLSSCEKMETTDIINQNSMTVNSSSTYTVDVEQNVKYGEVKLSNNKQYFFYNHGFKIRRL